MLRTAPLLPLERAFDAGLRARPFPDEPASLLPGLLAATRTGLPPASDDELTNKIHRYLTASPPALLGARKELTADFDTPFLRGLRALRDVGPWPGRTRRLSCWRSMKRQCLWRLAHHLWILASMRMASTEQRVRRRSSAGSPRNPTYWNRHSSITTYQRPANDIDWIPRVP